LVEDGEEALILFFEIFGASILVEDDSIEGFELVIHSKIVDMEKEWLGLSIFIDYASMSKGVH